MGCWLVAGLLLTASSAHAWRLWGQDDGYREFPLTAKEMQKLGINAGWTESAPQQMVFEIRNGLPQPVICQGASIELKEGGTLNKGFEPKLYVPGGATRKSSVSPVVKANVKTFGVTCVCMRRAPAEPCGNPFKD